MTCWHLRNTLFPTLWKYVEGCDLFNRQMVRDFSVEHERMVPLQNGLYAQCTYLILNRAICTYVQYVYPRAHLKRTHGASPCQGAFCGSVLCDRPEGSDDELC